MDDSTLARIVVGPDEQSPTLPAWSGVITFPDGEGDCIDGARGRGPRPNRYGDQTPDGWFRVLRRHVRLPKKVREAGLGWADAEVRPYGYSPGPGVAPQGIIVTWKA